MMAKTYFPDTFENQFVTSLGIEEAAFSGWRAGRRLQNMGPLATGMYVLWMARDPQAMAVARVTSVDEDGFELSMLDPKRPTPAFMEGGQQRFWDVDMAGDDAACALYRVVPPRDPPEAFEAACRAAHRLGYSVHAHDTDHLKAGQYWWSFANRLLGTSASEDDYVSSDDAWEAALLDLANDEEFAEVAMESL
jgi:hypothetical protein